MFNKSQIEAICHKEGPAIILAGPGSGKTTVITHRIKNLIEKSCVPPEKILVVTFTKAAAVHMKKRFLEIMNAEEETKNVSNIRNEMFAGGYIQKHYPVTFGTFHSIYYRILRLAYDYRGDSIVSDRMKNDFLKEIVIRLKIDVDCIQDFTQNISGEICRFKGNMEKLEEYRPSYCKREIFEKVFREYEKVLETERKIDFEDMLLKCYELLQNREDILRQWQEAFRYILIDEFQDINKIQYEIIKLLALPENNIFVVGDDDQSIYGFRGACPQIMFQFQKDYTNATEIHLSVNYRSTPQIVQLSKNLISHNSYRFKKNSVAFEKNGSEPDLRQFKTQSEELRYVCMKIKEYIKSGIRADEIAILLRNNSQISGVREFLQNEMISTHSLKGGNSIYKGMVAKDIIAYVKAALSITSIPLRENENLIYILNKPQRFISRQVIGQEGMDFQGLMRVYSHNTEILKNIERLRFHMNMIACLNPSAAIIYIRNGTEYERYLRQYARERNIKVENLIKQLDEIQNDVSKFSTLKEWLEYTESQQVVPEEIRNHDMVQIMTMHGSKGLEFRVVFILDANQGIIPSSRSVRERDYQEERRVFYVAMTRAAEKLHIYGVIKSLGCPMEISMFVAESLEKYAEKG